MFQLARETYSILQSQLGEQDYMFGDNATTLDCIVFGYLALHLYPDLSHRRLQHILTNEYPALARYCNRMNQLLFQQESLESEAAEDVPSLWRTFKNNPMGFLGTVKDDVVSYMGTETDEDKKEKSKSQVDFERKRIWSIAGGVTFFLAYVIYNGIVSIDLSGEDEEDYEYEEEYDDEE